MLVGTLSLFYRRSCVKPQPEGFGQATTFVKIGAALSAHDSFLRHLAPSNAQTL